MMKEFKKIKLNGIRVSLRHTRKMVKLIKGGYNDIEYITPARSYRYGGSAVKIYLIDGTDVPVHYTLDYDDYQYNPSNCNGVYVDNAKAEKAMVMDIIDFAKKDYAFCVKS